MNDPLTSNSWLLVFSIELVLGEGELEGESEGELEELRELGKMNDAEDEPLLDLLITPEEEESITPAGRTIPPGPTDLLEGTSNPMLDPPLGILMVVVGCDLLTRVLNFLVATFNTGVVLLCSTTSAFHAVAGAPSAALESSIFEYD